LGFLLLSWWLFSPGQMLSLLQRAFTPFTEVSIAKKTRITMMQPPEGNTSVRENQKVDFRVLIEGRVPRPKAPDAPMLCYRHRLSDEYRMIEMDQGADGEWTATVLADQVSHGFWYKVTAGDAETPEYQVKLRVIPQVVWTEVTYQHRPYRCLPDRTVKFPGEEGVHANLHEYRGTVVT